MSSARIIRASGSSRQRPICASACLIGALGDLHETPVRPVHLQDQEDRAGDGQRADEQRRNDGGVAARIETEAGEERHQPEHQHDEEGPGQGAPGLFVEQADGRARGGHELQGAALGRSLASDLGVRRATVSNRSSAGT